MWVRVADCACYSKKIFEKAQTRQTINGRQFGASVRIQCSTYPRINKGTSGAFYVRVLHARSIPAVKSQSDSIAFGPEKRGRARWSFSRGQADSRCAPQSPTAQQRRNRHDSGSAALQSLALAGA